MKAKKIVRYRLPVSIKFPATHARKGEPTHFMEKILSGQCKDDICSNKCAECNINRYVIDHTKKLHTIRGNYDLWAKRIEKIQRGEAVLELYYWSGKPYNSKCVTICQLGKEDGVGVQKATVYISSFGVFDNEGNRVAVIMKEEIAKNDGLSLEDFKEWFGGYDLSNPMAIIHFTSFRY